MKLSSFGAGREVGHEVKLSENLPDQFPDVGSLAQLIDVLGDAGHDAFRLLDRMRRKTFALLLQTPMMFGELLTEERRQASAGRTRQRPRVSRSINSGQSNLHGHFSRGKTQSRTVRDGLSNAPYFSSASRRNSLTSLGFALP